MFETLNDRMEKVFSGLRRKSSLRTPDIDAAMKEVRTALIEADVALPVVRAFVERVSKEASGQERIRGVNAGQQVIKVVHDHLVETLGSRNEELNLAANPPVAIMMVGLQGSGKTTSTAKIGRWLQTKGGGSRKVLMASLDVRRPAAQEQLALLGTQSNVSTLEIVAGESPVKIAQRAMATARRQGVDVVLLDTAGRLHLDDQLMTELSDVHAAATPTEVLLVADAMTGQDAVNIAETFKERAGVTGIVLTRVDGDARGGAALSMRAVTGCPIKFLGVGEKTDELEPFHPDRIAGRILGMGDVVSLVERAAEHSNAEDAARMRDKLQRGKGFDLDDMHEQLRQLERLGGLENFMNMIPGAKMFQRKTSFAGLSNDTRHINAILCSMTLHEKKNPRIILASRKKRIAAGAGVTIKDVNSVLKMHQKMNSSVKRVQKAGMDFSRNPESAEDAKKMLEELQQSQRFM